MCLAGGLRGRRCAVKGEALCARACSATLDCAYARAVIRPYTEATLKRLANSARGRIEGSGGISLIEQQLAPPFCVIYWVE